MSDSVQETALIEFVLQVRMELLLPKVPINELPCSFEGWGKRHSPSLECIAGEAPEWLGFVIALWYEIKEEIRTKGLSSERGKFLEGFCVSVSKRMYAEIDRVIQDKPPGLGLRSNGTFVRRRATAASVPKGVENGPDS